MFGNPPGFDRLNIFFPLVRITFRRSQRALCYNYPRSTRVVSIPAPVYYADTVCSRANHNFSPNLHLGSEEDWSASSDAGSGPSAEILEKYRKSFKLVCGRQRQRMYFQ
ncbi:hypothetical protein IW262DRAFT_886095 [Armillaria fumosa]|nr:hypothetical protein IW262DRAFT_886095 [Armillaria fumosa]